MLRHLLAALVALWFGAFPVGAAEIPVHDMGEPVRVGSLVYTVSSAEWRAVREAGRPEPVRYLEVRIRISNAGEEDVGIPPFRLVDESGGFHEDNDWLRVFPKMYIRPGEALTGRIYFHEPPQDAELRLLASSEFEAGTYAYVALTPPEGYS